MNEAERLIEYKNRADIVEALMGSRTKRPVTG